MKLVCKTVLSVCAVAALFAAHTAMAQTKTARGVTASSTAISSILPEFATLESEVNEATTLMEDIEGCGQDSRFYQASTGDCRTSDPVEVQFTDTGATELSIQRPDGSTAVYNLDGVMGVATVDGGGGGPDDPDPDNCTAPWGGTILHGGTVRAFRSTSGPCAAETRTCDNGTLSGTFTARTCRERMVCVRNGVTWEQGGLGTISGRFGAERHYCCEGVPESEAGRVAGIAVKREPRPSMLCP